MSRTILLLASVALSGVCFYLSLGLSGNYGYLFWIAPIPVLALSFNASAGKTFLIAFIAYLIGRLSWLSYLISVITLVPAIIFTLLLPLIFALIVMAARNLLINTCEWYSVFAFPVFFTAFEFLVLQFSPDGSAGSIAYSQSNILPLIQVASITGILGVTFIATFIPSAIATGWYFREQKNKLRYLTGCSTIIIVSVLAFGTMRPGMNSPKNTVRAGLAVLDENSHYITQHPDIQKESESATKYAELISGLAHDGAKLIVLPERAININKHTREAIISVFSNAARENHVFIVFGYTNLQANVHHNSAMVVDTSGSLVVDYNKVHLIKGMESQFKPGSNIALFKFNNNEAGTAICKDLDFPSYIRNYSVAGIDLLSVPAWDFVKDDWLHSRMAILRGVENGFSEVRTARLGRLTINDAYGRIIAEAKSSNGKGVILSGDVPLQILNTIYSRWGNWFGKANMIATMFFIFLIVKKKKHADKTISAI